MKDADDFAPNNCPRRMNTRVGWFRHVLMLAGKDLALQWRRREALFVVLLFALLVVLVFSFAMGPFFVAPQVTGEARVRELAKLASGVYWIAVAFAGVIAFHRSAEADRAHGAIKALRLAGIDASALYFGKVVSMTVVLGAVCLAMIPLTVAFFGVEAFEVTDALRLIGVALLGVVGLSALGAFVASLATGGGGRESLLSVMALPLMIPLLIAATKCSAPVFASEPLEEDGWFGLLAAFPLLMFGLGVLLFEAVLEE
ncbi:MAG: heme exporter protein CcmB [Candidatus Poribacteria bacterium]|nr:heme exporter protein CcmB [Candidatus Poribacteria bacterium]